MFRAYLRRAREDRALRLLQTINGVLACVSLALRLRAMLRARSRRG